jgi:hypothetical protein
MDVYIGEIQSSVRLTERVTRHEIYQIVREALNAMKDAEAAAQRATAERRISTGVRDELEGED